MKAVVIHENGGFEVLRYIDTPVPQLSQGQVLVRNDFCGVNYIDTYFRSGLYSAPNFPMTLGREGAGEVVAVYDPANSLVNVGDRVVYMGSDTGTYARYAVVSAAKAIVIPESLSIDKAAAVYLQGLTALTLVREAGDVQSGHWCLVHAAAGGVGLLLLQMLRSVGAKVIGTASTKEKLELARKNGAECVVNSNEDIVSKVMEITGGRGADIIFDGVGKDTFQADLDMIALKGTLISFGNASGAVPLLSILKLQECEAPASRRERIRIQQRGARAL